MRGNELSSFQQYGQACFPCMNTPLRSVGSSSHGFLNLQSQFQANSWCTLEWHKPLHRVHDIRHRNFHFTQIVSILCLGISAAFVRSKRSRTMFEHDTTTHHLGTNGCTCSITHHRQSKCKPFRAFKSVCIRKGTCCGIVQTPSTFVRVSLPTPNTGFVQLARVCGTQHSESDSFSVQKYLSEYNFVRGKRHVLSRKIASWLMWIQSLGSCL